MIKLFLTLGFILLLTGSLQAQTPTMQDLIDKVMETYQPIKSLHVDFTIETYYPSVGVEPPDSLTDTRQGEFVYLYPETNIFIKSDSLITDSKSYYFKRYIKEIGLTQYEKEIEYYVEDGDTTIIEEIETPQKELGERTWYHQYLAMFPAKLLFQFDSFIDDCVSAWLNGNPEDSIYVISTYYNKVPGNETKVRRDLYIDYSNGTIITIKDYDIGIENGSPENPILWSETTFSNFQEIEGINLPLTLEKYFPPDPYSMYPQGRQGGKDVITYIISVTP